MKISVVILFALVAILSNHACTAVQYELKKNGSGTACLIIDTTASISVNYFNTDGQLQVATWPLGAATSVDGICDSETDGTSASVNLTFTGYWLELQFLNKSSQVSLSSIELEIDASKIKEFVKPNETNRVLTANPNRQLSPASDYFACAAALRMSFEEALAGSFLSLAATKLQAFGLVDGKMSDKFATCAEDTSSTGAASTAPPATTAVVPTTSAAPSSPPLLNFTVWNNATAGPCLRLQLSASLAITYQLKAGGNATVSIQLPADTRYAGGSCGNATQLLQLAFNTNWNFSIGFTKQSSGYALSWLQLDYALVPQLFPNASTPNLSMSAIGNQTYISVSSGDYYACTAKQSFAVNGLVRLDTSNLRAQAFRTNNSTAQFYGTPLECVDDTPIDNVVPIVVGASLAALVIIVLIAYLIGRRRQGTGGGYQSV